MSNIQVKFWTHEARIPHVRMKKTLVFLSLTAIIGWGLYATGFIDQLIEHPEQNSAELLLLIAAGLFIWRNSWFAQPEYAVFVQDDTKIITVADLVAGKPDKHTKLYVDCAVLSANIYKESQLQKHVVIEDAEHSDDRIMTEWEEMEALYDDEIGNVSDNKLGMEVWKSDQHKLIAIVFRGTVKGVNSWFANFHWLLHYLPVNNQYHEIQPLIPKIISRLDGWLEQGYEVISTGHSLGGGLAQHANYLHPAIVRSYVFNSTPVTGWREIKRQQRDINVENRLIYRMFERGEILQYLRFVIKIADLFDPRPNLNPMIIEHRLDLTKTGVIASHSIASLACGLRDVSMDHTDKRAKYDMLSA